MMEIDFAELKRIVLDLSVTSVSTLEYRDRTYYVEPAARDGPPGESFVSTYYDGADIYVWKRVPKQFRRPVIVHEVVEADLSFYQGVPRSVAHQTAVEIDRRFASETLDALALAEYELFRERCERSSRS